MMPNDTPQDWTLGSPWIDFAPVARTIGLGAPGEVLRIVEFVLRSVVVLIVSDGPLLVDGPSENQTVPGYRQLHAHAEPGQLTFLHASYRAAACLRILERRQSCLSHGHKRHRGDTDKK